MIAIEKVNTCGNALDEVKILIREYVLALDVNLQFQQVEPELKNPLQKYSGPEGCLLLARYRDQPAGCIALQPLQLFVCEMKRLYTKPHVRNLGIGNLLIEHLIIEARSMGYKQMMLDTLSTLTAAISLYKQHGFEETSAYYINPLSGVVFMQKQL